MKCPSCNTDGVTGLYCSNCGAKLSTNNETTQDANPNLENNKDAVQSGLQEILTQHDSKQNKKIGLTAKPIYIIFGIIGILILIAIINSNYANTKEKETNYQQGIQSIKDGKWNDATISFSILLQDNYKDSKILYNYAQSHVRSEKNDFNMALYYTNEIPANYNGILSDDVKNYKTQLESNKVKYGFDLMERQNYDNAATWFYGLMQNDETLKPLYNYAQAAKHYFTGDFSMAKSYAQDINNYSGYGSDVVTAFKEKLLSELTPEKIQAQEAREKAAKKSEGVRIGMTKQEVLDSSWGRPNHINKTTGSYGVHEQWVYNINNYLYFENGILTTIQN